MKKSKKQIFIFNQYYYPAFKAGGPIKSIKLIKDKLDKKFLISIFTSSFDIDNKKVFRLKKKVKGINHFDNFFSLIFFLFKNYFFKKLDNTIYFNSFFNFKYTIFPLVFFKFFTCKNNIILAPRGELFDSELKKKFLKKIIYLLFFKIFLKDKIIFHATSIDEKKVIKKIFFKNKIKLLSNLVEEKKENNLKFQKISYPLKFIYFSRISQKKNLLETLSILSKVKFPIALDIYGPIENNHYWEKIRIKIIEIMKKKKKLVVKYKGLINHDKYKIINKYNFFILLSDSENFGHVIFESILSKCIPIITKNSPWKKFEKFNCGLFLDIKDKFAQKKIEFFIKSVQKNPKKIHNKLDQIVKTIYQEQSKINYEKFFTRI